MCLLFLGESVAALLLVPIDFFFFTLEKFTHTLK